MNKGTGKKIEITFKGNSMNYYIFITFYFLLKSFLLKTVLYSST